MTRALFRGRIPAGPDAVGIVVGNVGRPPATIRRAVFSDGDRIPVRTPEGTVRCRFIDGGTAADAAAWYHAAPGDAAARTGDGVAFRPGVEIRR